MKWKAAAGQWSLAFYTHVTGWANRSWITIIQPVT